MLGLMQQIKDESVAATYITAKVGKARSTQAVPLTDGHRYA